MTEIQLQLISSLSPKENPCRLHKRNDINRMERPTNFFKEFSLRLLILHLYILL